jgi:hypothetical protein
MCRGPAACRRDPTPTRRYCKTGGRRAPPRRRRPRPGRRG